MLGRQVAGNQETRFCSSARAESAVCIAEYVQALLRRDTRKEPDRKRTEALARPGRVAVQVYSERRDTHLRFRHAEISGHVISVVAADRKKHINVVGGGPNQIERLRSIWFTETVEE